MAKEGCLSLLEMPPNEAALVSNFDCSQSCKACLDNDKEGGVLSFLSQTSRRPRNAFDDERLDSVVPSPLGSKWNA